MELELPRVKFARIGNVQPYFIWWQFYTLGGVANIDQNICHRKVKPVTPYLWQKCDKSVTPQDIAVTLLWQMGQQAKHN